MTLRAIVVGPGYIGRRHMAAYASHPHAECVCVVPRSQETASRLAEETGVAARLDLVEALRHFAPDVVSVCSPTALHAEHAVTALRAGAHVLVEKPLAGRIEEGRGIVEAGRRAQRVVMAAHTTLFEPALSRLVALVRRGALGAVRELRFERRGRDVSPGELEKGRGPEVAADGGPDESLYDHLLHVTYVLNRLAGATPARVAVGEREARRWHERLRARVDYKGGVTAWLDLSSRAEDAFTKRWRVVGAQGEAEAVLAGGEAALRWRRAGEDWQSPALSSTSAFDAVVHHFLDAILWGRHPLESGEDGLRAMALAASLAGGFPGPAAAPPAGPAPSFATARAALSLIPGRDEEGRAAVAQAVVRLTDRCDLRCVHCWVRPGGEDLAPAHVAEQLELAVAHGARQVAFSGGEPTLRPDELVAAVAALRGRSQARLMLQTNGLRLGEGELAGRLAAAGLDQAFVSLASHVPATFDAYAGRAGQLPRVLAGIDAALEAGLETYVNQVVCAINFRELPDFADFLVARWGPRVVYSFSYATVDGEADSLRAALPPFSALAPLLRGALDRMLAAGMRVESLQSACGLPLCVLDADERYYGPIAPLPEGAAGEAWRQPPLCATCSLAAACRGPRREYVAAWGEDGLRAR